MRICGLSAHPQVAERTIHHFDLFLEVRVAHVDHMHEQIGFARFVEGRFERLDQVGRELADETYRVGQ